MTIRESFVDRFGEDAAQAVESAAAVHRADLIDGAEHGDDPFADAFSVAIGFECVGRYREDHGIEPSENELREWCRQHRVLDRHVGPVDYIALVAGAYNDWFPEDVREVLDGGAA